MNQEKNLICRLGLFGNGKSYAILDRHLADVDQSVAHAAQCGIDRNACNISLKLKS